MAIDPTAPLTLTPIPPAAPPGSQPNSVVLQAVARAALANTTNHLSELVGRPSADAAKPRHDVEQADKASTQDGGRAAVSLSSGSGVSNPSAARPPPQETRLMRAVRLAATDAVSRQAGLAPLMADVRAAIDRSETPPGVRAAGETLLARLPRDYEMSAARGLRRAVEQSGVFLEARLAKSSASAPGGHALPASTGADLKAALLVFRSALSNYVAPTVSPSVEAGRRAGVVVEGPPAANADHAAKTPTPLAATPSQRGDAIAEEEAPPPPLAVPESSSEAPEAAVPLQGFARAEPSSSGEQETAALARSSAVQPPAPQDDEVESRFAAFLAPSKPAPATQPAKPISSMLGLLELAEASSAADEPLASITHAPLAARGYSGAAADSGKPRTPPPPFADGPMAGQHPMASELPPHAASDEIVRRLLKGASAALARQDLMQIASLREIHHDPETGETRPQPARLNLDVPFVTPQGVAVAQFEIARDGGGAGGAMVGPAERGYRVRFSIDVEPLGPVHALVSLSGSRARVSLWAERAETIARLRAGEEALGAALREAALTPEIAVHSGPPPVKDSGALGHFVDQAS